MDAVSSWAIQAIRKPDSTSDGHEVKIKVVVYQVELLGRSERTRSAVDFAGEFTVSGIVFVFPHLKRSVSSSVTKEIAGEKERDSTYIREL
jgi:hypothetical protein